MKRGKPAGLLIFCVVMFGCATPAQRFSEYAQSQGFTPGLVKTTHFQHRLFMNQRASQGTVHVYIDGDGSPWIRRHWIAEDPTSRNPLILDLMKQDRAASILLGRPCYHGVGNPEQCEKRWWTSHRYAKQVVDSMLEALEQWLVDQNVSRIVLIGFSGGGTLAMLMAPNINQLTRVVTVAGNLNVQAWNTLHGYSPLTGSLNPSDQVDKFQHIRQLHLAARDDQVVPVSLIKAFAAASGDARLIVYPGFDHVCCWNSVWPEILRKISVK